MGEKGDPNYPIKGRIAEGQEVLLAAVPKDSSLLYFLTFARPPVVVKETNATIPGPEGIAVFDPRTLAEMGQLAKVVVTSADGTLFRFRVTQPTDVGFLPTGTPQLRQNAAATSSPSSTPGTFTLRERTGIAVDELRAEGRYTLTAANRAPLRWARFLPVTDERTRKVEVQRTARNQPYVTADDLRMMFIPTTLYDERCVQITDVPTIVRHVRAYVDYVNGRTPVPPFKLYVSRDECEKGGWYSLCYGGHACGKCYGKCPGKAKCVVSYDKQAKKLKYGCGVVRDEELAWYETWWILVVIGLFIVVVIVVVLMLVHYNTVTKREAASEGNGR